MKILHEGYNITDYVADPVTWSGSAYQAARSLTFSVLNKDINIKLGDRVQLWNDNKLLIDASVTSRERNSTSPTINITAYDDLNRMLKSKANYKFTNITPEAITKKVCQDLGVSVGTLASTNHHIKKMIIDGESPYDIILSAYKKADGKYQIGMDGRKLTVFKKGTMSGVTLADDYNITGSTFTQSLDEMINKVKVYNDKGVQTQEVKNADNIKKYGIYQDVTTETPALHGITNTASIDVDAGDVRALAGRGIQVQDKASGLYGIYWINTDTHTWEKGLHYMTLDIAFTNVMGGD